MYLYGFAKRLTMEDYQNGYKGVKNIDNPHLRKNLEFYQNRRASKPRGDLVENIHRDWAVDFDLLERHHGYIQWLFPIHEKSAFNPDSQVLQRHEARAIREDPDCMRRFVATLRMMLNFWGIELLDKTSPVPTSGKCRRCADWERQFKNMRLHGHNNMRITRMLKCLGELGLEHYKFHILSLLVDECFLTMELHKSADSCRRYWVPTLRNVAEREALLARITTIIGAMRKRQVHPSGALTGTEADIGVAVRVFWAREKKWYDGRVTAVAAKDGVAVWTVYYDDTDRKLHQLGHGKWEKFEVLTSPSPSYGDAIHPGAAPEAGASQVREGAGAHKEEGETKKQQPSNDSAADGGDMAPAPAAAATVAAAADASA